MEKLSELLTSGKKLRNLSVIKSAMGQIVFFSVSFLMSAVSFAGGLSPFAAAFTSGVSTQYFLASALGSAAGYAIFFGLFDSLRFISAICLLALIRLGIYDKIIKKRRIFFVPLFTFSSLFLSSAAVAAATSEGAAYIILCFSEALIAAAYSAFTMKLTEIAALNKKGAFFAPTDTVSVIFFSCVLLLSLDRFSVFGFSPARCTGYFAIMLFALCGKESASSVAGISCALTLGFNENQPHLMASYILTGLFTGLTGVYGKIPVALSLVISSSLSLILSGSSESAVTAIAETVTAGIIFVFIPEKYLFRMAQRVIPLSRDAYSEEKGRNLRFTLKRSAKAVKDISSSVNAVSALLQKSDKPSTKGFSDFVREDVCRGCIKYDFCWDKCSALSQDAFEKARKTLLTDGKLITEKLPQRLSVTCRFPDRIADSFNMALCRHNAFLVAKKDIFNAKKAAAEQFFLLGSILDDAAENLCSIPESDPVLANALMPVFSETGFSLLGLSAFTSVSGKKCVQAYCSHIPPMTDISLLREKLFEATGISFSAPVADEYTEEGTVLSFCEELKFSVKYHTSQHTGAGEEFPGDTAECFFDGNGFFYAVLSDGMGSGTRAALDSVMTCSLVSRLMRTGFSPECAIEAVNCALLIKSADETLSTLDILKINLETGLCEFYKAGAAASIIKKADKTLAVEKSSLPLGILRETGFEKSEISLSDGDMILLMSDGAGVIPHIRFKDMLRENKNNSVSRLSETAVKTALELSPAGKHDDITVTCIKITENKV